MPTYTFTCRSCGWSRPPEQRPNACPNCGPQLEISHENLPGELSTRDRHDLFRYEAFLPTEDIDPVSNGEGWTPLVETPAVAEIGDGNGDATVLLKNETTNPTWSWKDRMAALVISHAVADGADRVATSTTGNHGSAIAAYATRAGVDRMLVFVRPSSEFPHHAQIRTYGAESIQLTDPDQSGQLLDALAERGWTVAYDLPDRYTHQPYVYEAYKTIAFEIVEQHGVPDAVVAAVGAGDGLYGIWKGFRELRDAGIVEETPRMISAEAEARQPLARAYERGADEVGPDHGPEPLNTSTKSPTTGDHALAAVKHSGGRPVTVDRETLERAIRACGQDGVFLEPASGLAAAGSAKIAAGEEVETVVAVGSGAGVAWPEKTAEVVGRYPTVDPSLSAIEDAVPFSLE